MATCRTIIRRAMQKLALVAPGDEPESSEAVSGLAALQGLFDSWASGGMFGRLDAFINADLPANVLEYALPEPGAPVELPVLVRDGAGDAVTPPDLAYAEYVDQGTGDFRRYLWDARRAAWVRIDGLALDTECPLSRRGEEGLAAMLAMAVAEEYGRQPGPVTMRQAGTFNRGLSAGYGETATETAAVYF